MFQRAAVYLTRRCIQSCGRKPCVYVSHTHWNCVISYDPIPPFWFLCFHLVSSGLMESNLLIFILFCCCWLLEKSQNTQKISSTLPGSTCWNSIFNIQTWKQEPRCCEVTVLQPLHQCGVLLKIISLSKHTGSSHPLSNLCFEIPP